MNFFRAKNLFKFKSVEQKIAYRDLQEINKLQPLMAQLSDQDLKMKTSYFKNLLSQGKTLTDIRVEVYAVAREATKRVLNKFPYDVQILGGVILDLGSVAEMKTGEGKTITSIAPVYLNALEGKGVIISTVNEYLSERDATEMGKVFNFLGMSVGINKSSLMPFQKKIAYDCDITYSVHSELGFDYLRDNMAMSKYQKVQRSLNYILIDEVDSILIDEAKTPLIISGGKNFVHDIYQKTDAFVKTLKDEHFQIDQESRAVFLTEAGVNYANKYFNFPNLYAVENSELVHRIQNALMANKVMKKNVEYIIKEQKIELVDSFTGRVMEGRSYSRGLQQAIQAKEEVEIESETNILATITYQNFFRLFKKISGMTGTAKTEEQEFIDIYNMRVNEIPTNKPMIREEAKDEIYFDETAKNNAIVKEVLRVYAKGQPLLVGTSQVEESEKLHLLFNQYSIPHKVLNAKQNRDEAEIISHAGQVKSVVIATNMAGRGTDIIPSMEALKLGGLYVLGTQKAESRRIDNQLKGRSGRQGDIGYVKFFLSLDDVLIQRFSLQSKFKKLFAVFKDQKIDSQILVKSFERAQKKIEGFNYDSRKSILNYDDIIRQQRDIFYSQRDLILNLENLNSVIRKLFYKTIKSLIANPKFKISEDSLDLGKLINFLNGNFLEYSLNFKFDSDFFVNLEKKDLAEKIFQKIFDFYLQVRENIQDYVGKENVTQNERQILLEILDKNWQNHITIMDKLKSSSYLVQYSQKNPFQVYSENSLNFFEIMNKRNGEEVMVALLNNPYLKVRTFFYTLFIDNVRSVVVGSDKSIRFNQELEKDEAEKIRDKILENFHYIEQKKWNILQDILVLYWQEIISDKLRKKIAQSKKEQEEFEKKEKRKWELLRKQNQIKQVKEKGVKKKITSVKSAIKAKPKSKKTSVKKASLAEKANNEK